MFSSRVEFFAILLPHFKDVLRKMDSGSWKFFLDHQNCTKKILRACTLSRKINYFFRFALTSLIDCSNTERASSISFLEIVSGGEILIVDLPAVIRRTPRFQVFDTMSPARSVANAFDFLSFTISSPIIKPFPRTSPMISYFSFHSFMILSMYEPCLLAFPRRSFFSMKSMTASPAAAATGFPPKVLA